MKIKNDRIYGLHACKILGLRTTVIIKLTRNGHPSAVQCSLFGIWSGIGLKHFMHVVVVISERLLKNFSNTCQDRTDLPMLANVIPLLG